MPAVHLAVDRRDFLQGALAAGVGSLAALASRQPPADNTAAIAAALPNVLLPPGVFDIDPVLLVSGTRLSGAGVGLTTLRLAPRTITDDPAFGGALNVHGVAGAPISDVVISDLTIDGNARGLRLIGAAEGLNIEAVSFSYAELCSAIRVRAVNAYSDGFDFDDCVACDTLDCAAEDCGGFGFHNSLRSRGNIHIRARAARCGFRYGRGGFDVHGTPGRAASGIAFLSCHADACYRGFLIGGDRNLLRGCVDVGGSEPSEIRGSDNRVEACDLGHARVFGTRNTLL